MEIRWYMTSTGNSPVLDYCRSLSIDQRAIVGKMIREVQDRGLASPLVSARQYRGKLWELRPGYHRIFYVVAGQVCVLLHAYQKDSEKTPQREANIAEQRMREVLSHK